MRGITPILETRHCEWCGQQFNPVRRVQRFCGLPCQKKHWNKVGADKKRAARELQAAGVERRCLECGSPLFPRHLEYCSKSCRARGRRRREYPELPPLPEHEASAAQGERVECLRCGHVFISTDRRRNRICARCKELESCQYLGFVGSEIYVWVGL